MTKKRQIDWEKIELDYRAGIKTLRQIADEHGISNPAILKRAKRDDWTRDLSAKIAKKAEALVSKETVSNSVSKERLANEKQIIDANAEVVADIVLSHRKDFVRFKKTISDLQKELDELSALKDYENLAMRTKVLKDLTDTYAKLVALERQTYNMDKEVEKTADPLTELITTIAKTNKSTFGVVTNDPEYGDEQ